MNEVSPTRLAFIACGNGGVIDALGAIQRRDVWPYEIVGVITDRPCGAEFVATSLDVPHERLENRDNPFFNHFAAEILRDWKADCVVLLYLKRIGAEIWRDLGASVWNLHPSLLPAYPGIGALSRNFSDSLHAARHGQEIRMGVTIHLVNDDLDGGPIISQRWFGISDAATFQQASHWAFLYKVALVLEGICKWRDGTLPSPQQNNRSEHWLDRYALWTPYESMTDVMVSIAEPWAARILEQKVGALPS